ncbi:MAG: transposase [Opitutales bacterium]|nr:transposase [Opitutales bacterium]NRA26033.1 transposase [Opitutales bacterium]
MASLRHALRGAQAIQAGKGTLVSSASTLAYAQARGRLKTALIQDAHQRVLNALGAGETVSGFDGHRIHLVDSTTVAAADTPDTQKCFPQSSQCAPGCGFPLIRLTALFDLNTGAIETSSVTDQNTSEITAALCDLIPRVKVGEILVGDRAYSTYGICSQFQKNGAFFMMRTTDQRVKHYTNLEPNESGDRLVKLRRPQNRNEVWTQQKWARIPAFVPNIAFENDSGPAWADAARFKDLREKVVEAFQGRFVTEAGWVACGSQTSYVLAIHFDLLKPEQIAEAGRKLVEDIENRGMHLATGFVGTPYLLDALEKTGHLEVAYALLEQTTFPSWLFPVTNGATTVWELWDSWTPDKGFSSTGMNSFNHYAFGAVADWIVRSVGGIDLVEAEPGYATVVIRPRPGGSITWAETSFQSERGEISVKWSLASDGQALDLAVMIPENVTPRLDLPAEWVRAPVLKTGFNEFTLQRN